MIVRWIQFTLSKRIFNYTLETDSLDHWIFSDSSWCKLTYGLGVLHAHSMLATSLFIWATWSLMLNKSWLYFFFNLSCGSFTGYLVANFNWMFNRLILYKYKIRNLSSMVWNNSTKLGKTQKLLLSN